MSRYAKYRRALRDRAWAIFGKVCVICGAPANQLAHRFPTGLCSAGRGMDRRYRDVIANPECYAPVCGPEHNRAVWEGNE